MKPRLFSRAGRILLLLLGAAVSLTACTSVPSPPEEKEYSSLLSLLPEDAPLYFTAGVNRNGELLTEIFSRTGMLKGNTLDTLIKRTSLAVGAVSSLPETEGELPGIALLLRGEFPNTLIKMGLSLDAGWLRHTISGGETPYEAWVNETSGLFLVFLDHRTLFAASGEPEKHPDIAADYRKGTNSNTRYPGFVHEKFFDSGISVYMDTRIFGSEGPGNIPVPLGRGVFEGIITLKLPIRESGLTLDPAESDQERPYRLSGFFRLGSSRQAKVFQGSFRFIILGWAVREGYNSKEIIRDVTVERDDDRVVFSGIPLSQKDITGLFPKKEEQDE
ncbi:MAG: hypothetical protein ACLFSE_04600 [Spirochaetia bacterium]